MTATRLFNLGAGLYAGYTNNSAWRASCKALAAHLPPEARTVLDLGCGPGTALRALAQELPAARWVGGDIARRMLGLARRNLAAPLPVGLVRLDAQALPFAAESMDGVAGHSFLYLVPDEHLVLAEVYRVLRPGGRAAFMEPAHGYVSPARTWAVSRDPRFLLSIPPWRVMSRRHRRYSAVSFRQALQTAGFGDLHCTPTLGGLGFICSGARRAVA